MGVPTGGNLNAAHGSITISTTQAQQAPAVMAGVAQGINRAMGTVNNAMVNTAKGIGGLLGSFQGLISALGIPFGVAGAIELGKLAAAAEGARDSFDQLAAGVGHGSDALLQSMRRASRGAISDADLILSANRAISSGVADTGAEINKLLEIARASGRAYGFTAAEAFDKIVRAVAKLEPELLDEIGIFMQLDTVFRSYAASLGKTAQQLTETERRQAMLNEVVRQSKDEVDNAAQSGDDAADKTGQFGAALENLKVAAGDVFNALQFTDAWTTDLRKATEELKIFVEWLEKAKRWGDSLRGVRPTVSSGFFTAASGGMPASGVAPSVIDPNAPAIAKAKLDWAEGIDDLNKKLHADIIDAEKSYGRARQSAVREYQLGVSREADDFALSRQRQEQELNDSILRINRDAGRREQRLAEDLGRGIARAEADSAERVADARKDHDKRLAEMDEDFKKNQQRREEDFRDDLLSAAGRLDAVAILELRKGRARELKDAREAHEEQRRDLDEQLRERLDDEAESLDKSIAQQREAYDRQLADARAADAERIADMKEDFAKRQAQEDIDRGIRLQRQAEDHANQLAEMDIANAERLQQIRDNAAEERRELQEAADAELVRLKAADEATRKRVEAKEKHLEDMWDKFHKHIEDSFKPSREHGVPYLTPMAAGGYVPRTMAALLHAGEYVLPAPAVAAGGMMGGRISIGDISIAIAGTTDMGAGELRPLIYEVLVDALVEVSRRR